MSPAIRPARPEDAPELARLHVASWAETYPGLLPEAEIAARDYGMRLEIWEAALTHRTTRIALAPGRGFAQMGKQREAARAEAYPEELWTLYALRAAHGTGLGPRLLCAVRGPAAFTASTLATNARACAFYTKMGGRDLGLTEPEDGHPDRLFGFAARS